MLQFELLKSELGTMGKWRRCLFAAMTAERTAEWFRLYAKHYPDEITTFDDGLSYLWSRIGNLEDFAGSGENKDSEKARVIEKIIPHEDDDTQYSAQAEDAASALTYAIRSLCAAGDTEAVWAAERAYNLIDNYVNSTPDASGNFPAKFVDSHLLLDREISERNSDLNLARLSKPEDLTRLRESCSRRGEAFVRSILGST